jgi:beta-glucanase (GH16 family)
VGGRPQGSHREPAEAARRILGRTGARVALAVALAAGVGVALLSTLTGSDAPVTQPPVEPVPGPRLTDGRELAFAEDFSSDLDPTVWADCFDIREVDGCTNYWNGELQWFHPDQQRVVDGNLVLTLDEVPHVTTFGRTYDYRSGMVTTRPGFALTYGYVEFEVDHPVGQGVWPALWLLPTSGAWPPELDVLEVVGHEPETAYFNVHHPWDGRSREPDGTELTDAPAAAVIDGLSDGFHRFGLDWRPDRLDWYVDGVLHHSDTDASRIPDEPMYLVMTLSTGGEWAGPPDASTPLPASLLVDSVKVWHPADAPPG